MLATEVYIRRVDQCSCGDAVINLYKGSNSEKYLKERESLLVFLKGSEQRKRELKQSNPALYQKFETVWTIRCNHLQPNLPPQYIFYLICCFKSDCPHPLCSSLPTMPLWYPEGPPVSYLPFPIPDTSRPWGNANCAQCMPKLCSGHYLPPSAAIVSHDSPAISPPSVIIKAKVQANNNLPLSTLDLEEIAKATLLSVDEVSWWVDHLIQVSRNRKEGARKAAATRQRKKQEHAQSSASVSSQCLQPPSQPAPVREESACSTGSDEECRCGVCDLLFMEETQEVETWIVCEAMCNTWFHIHCVGLDIDTIPNCFICSNCSLLL